jgi:hypothetical protein
MKKYFFILFCFLIFAESNAKKKQVVFLQPDTSLNIDCFSDTMFDKNKIDIVVQDYIEKTKKEYGSLLDATSFKLLEAVIWNNFVYSNCVEKTVAEMKITAIVEEIRSVRCEAVLVFLSRFGFKPSFSINKKVLYSTAEVLSFFEGTDDSFLSMKNSIRYTHIEALLLVAKTLNKAGACLLIKEIEDFLKSSALPPETFQREIADLKATTKCD